MAPKVKLWPGVWGNFWFKGFLSAQSGVLLIYLKEPSTVAPGAKASSPLYLVLLLFDF